MEPEMIAVENEILDKLAGKVTLMQNMEAKKDAMFKVFLDVYNSEKGKALLKQVKGIEIESFFNSFLSYGLIEDLLNDQQVEDIMINSLGPIFVHKTNTGLVKLDKRFTSSEELNLFIKKLIIFSGKTQVRKINNIVLYNIKGRGNIVFSPFGPQVTITRAKEKPLSIIELIANRTLSFEIAAQLWLYVEGLGIKPANLIISGGPGTGKTTLLNALLAFMPSEDRLVVIEDTLELNTELEENCSRLESDEEVTLADLVKNSLRMRPDRVIVGEVRGAEAADLMTAMNIGKYCMGTMHASTARETIMRLENEPMNVPEVLVNLIDVFVITRRFNIDGKIVRAIGEVVETAGMEKKLVLLSPVWTFDYSKRKFVEAGVSSVYRDKLAEVSGVSPRDIIEEIKLRIAVLKFLHEKNIMDNKDVTLFCRKYHTSRKEALDGIGFKYGE
ncbi:MAG: ATPase, T2SS/T4P/T4SS family [Candidatus Omnitrophota bacterium]|nr:ATPase, T2SS/T4P/T4SS family [Candidatus Omnitrophota bacterium]